MGTLLLQGVNGVYRTNDRPRNIKSVESIDLQSIGADIRIYGEIDDPAMRDFNPSLAWHEDVLYVSIRSCNFKVDRHGAWSFRDGSVYSRTDVLLGDLDPDTLKVTNLQPLKLSKNSPKNILLAGLEDVRLFSRKDGLHAIGFESDRLTRSLHNASAGLAEYLIKGNELVYLRSLQKPQKDVVEKNWSPTDTPSKLFDFTYSDSQVWKDGKLMGEPTKTQIHGGSQLLQQKDGTWLSLVHEKKLEQPQVPYTRYSRPNNIYDKYVYYTYLAKHDKQGIITKLSQPFRFGTLENIEFASGLVQHRDDFIISIGIRDCKYAIVKIPKEKLMSLL